MRTAISRRACCRNDRRASLLVVELQLTEKLTAEQKKSGIFFDWEYTSRKKTSLTKIV